MDLIVVYVALILVCAWGPRPSSPSSETALCSDCCGHTTSTRSSRSRRDRAPWRCATLIGSTSRLLVTILLGNNIVNILGASVAAALAIRLLGPEVGIIVSTVVMTVLVLVFSEIIPKAIAARHPRRVSLAVGLPLYLIHQLLRPVHALFDRGIEPLVRRITGGGDAMGDTLSPEDVLRLARQAVDEGTDNSTPLAIIGATSAAADMTVEEIMVPRTEIFAVPARRLEPAEPSRAGARRERYTRVPHLRGVHRPHRWDSST